MVFRKCFLGGAHFRDDVAAFKQTSLPRGKKGFPFSSAGKPPRFHGCRVAGLLSSFVLPKHGMTRVCNFPMELSKLTLRLIRIYVQTRCELDSREQVALACVMPNSYAEKSVLLAGSVFLLMIDVSIRAPSRVTPGFVLRSGANMNIKVMSSGDCRELAMKVEQSIATKQCRLKTSTTEGTF
jgi:hypothetical protein